MPEYRRDPISQRWVILAQDRAGRPSEFASQPERRAQQPCPFCAGQEVQTPPGSASYPGQLVSGSPSATARQARAIPNKYPAVLRESAPVPPPSGPPPFGTSFPGHGEHEVIIESPRNVASLTDLTPEQAVWAFHAYRDRLREHGTRSDLRYGLLFKNCRGGAGATLEHAHSQLGSTNFVPGEVEQGLRSAA